MLLSKLDFGAYLTYTPRGTSDKAKFAKDIMTNIKNEKALLSCSTSEFIARKIKEEINNLPFKDFFGENIFLVPVPKSSLINPGSLWVPEPCLKRIIKVPKSAFSKPSERPKAILTILKILKTPA